MGIWEMLATQDWDNKAFTEKAFKIYADALRARLPRIKFLLHNDVVQHAIDNKLLRVVGKPAVLELPFSLNPHIVAHQGKIDDDMLAQAVAEAFIEPLVTAAEAECDAQREDRARQIGAGQLWVLHNNIPAVSTHGGQAFFATDDAIGLFGETWFDINGTRENQFLARAAWSLARSGEIQKEPLDLDVLRRGAPPL